MPALKWHSVSARLIVSTLFFSSIVTLAATSLQLYIDYARDVDLIHERMRQIRDSYVKSISASLWALDREQLVVQVEGIRSLPDMQRVEVVVDGAAFASAGRVESSNLIVRTFPLVHHYKDQSVTLGALSATASLDGVYSRLLDKVFVILGTQAIKTFLVSAFLFLLFQYLVTRHLVHMSNYARALVPGTLGTPLHLERSEQASAPPDELDDVVHAINEMRDNLRQSWSELEAEHTRRVEAETLAGIGQFSASIAHEIRNPLASIINGAELLGRDNISAANKTEVIALVNAESQRLKRILDDFLRFSRQQKSHPEPNDLAQVIHRVAETVRLGLTGDRRIEIATETDPPPGLALFDRERIEQVLWNLILNGVQAMPDGGRLVVAAMRDGASCVVRVTDTGIGMSAEFSARATQPFTSGRAAGTGLGLSIVERILADHGSALSIVSAPGVGTTVTFALETVDTSCAKS